MRTSSRVGVEDGERCNLPQCVAEGAGHRVGAERSVGMTPVTAAGKTSQSLSAYGFARSTISGTPLSAKNCASRAWTRGPRLFSLRFFWKVPTLKSIQTRAKIYNGRFRQSSNYATTIRFFTANWMRSAFVLKPKSCMIRYL